MTTESAETHRHITDPDRRTNVVEGLEYSLCFCLITLIRQIPDKMSGIVSLPIPRNWDLAYDEAIIDYREHLAAAAEDGAHFARVVDRARRESFLRDLKALARFYVDNPAHPVPEYIVLNHYVDKASEVAVVAEGFCHGRSYRRGEVEGGMTDHLLPNMATTMCLVTAVRRSHQVPGDQL
jgi:hypothetical protein